MSNIKSIPELYQGLTRSSEITKHCIVEDVHGGFYRFDKPEAIHIVKQAIQKVWPNFDAFEKENKQTVLAYHEDKRIFGKPAPKDQSHTDTASWVWYKIASIAADRTPQVIRTESGRKSTISSRKYFIGAVPEGTGDLKTPQALACIKLFRAALVKHGEKTGDPGKEITHISEEKLKLHIDENAADLKTRQDPWRIFQYYRKDLLNAKLIRHD